MSYYRSRKATMDAPLYPPAHSYDLPAVDNAAFGVDSVSAGDLLRSPGTRTILRQEISNFDAIEAIPWLRPHLGNFTLRGLGGLGVVSPEEMSRIEARLRALPLNERPGL